MAVSERLSADPTRGEAMEHLRSFFSACNKVDLLKNLDFSKNPKLKDVLETGFYLMNHMSVSRDAVLYEVSKIYSDLVCDYVSQLENKQSVFGEGTDELLAFLDAKFGHNLESKPDLWSPLLSTWSISLLGQISSQHSQRQVLSRAQTVNEAIHTWMSCKAIKSLLEIASKCLRSLPNKDIFITTLLDTSAYHSPNFDWVVAHIGNSYPQTMVALVLSLGLQNFSTTSPPASKLSSVAGILGHLVTAHSKEIQFSFDSILQDGLAETDTVKANYAIPYLLQLCSSSVPLLDVLMDAAIPKVNDETLVRLAVLAPKWISLHFGGAEVPFMALLTHLILKSTKGARALFLLMNGCKSWPSSVQSKAKSLLYHFTAEISSLVYRSDSARKDLGRSFACIQSLKDEYETLLPFLLDCDNAVSRISQHFIKILSLYDSKDIGVSAVCYYLNEAEQDNHLWSMVDIICVLCVKYPSILSDCLKLMIVRCGRNADTRCWKTLLRLLKTKMPPSYAEYLNVAGVVRENISLLIPYFDARKRNYSLEKARLIAEILCLVPDITRGVRFGVVLSLERYLVELLFEVLSDINGRNRKGKVRTVSHVSKLLHELASNQAVQNDSLRWLVQTSLNPENRHLFQPKLVNFKFSSSDPVPNDNDFQVEKLSMYSSILHDNRRRAASISSARVHSTSFLTGNVERNRLPNRNLSRKAEIIVNNDAKINLRLFLGVIAAVSAAKPGNKARFGHGYEVLDPVAVSEDASRQVALLLVQTISPDVMFNGLPWPEEEFSKVQVERDIQIRKSFEDHPYLWDLLEFVGNYCPSLCYCSVLLRALMATLMAYWTTQQESRSTKSPTQLEWTVRLVNIMKHGQLLPPPLCYIGQVLSELKANEIVGLLKDIWTYMKLNVPVPSVFVKDPTSKMCVRTAEFYKLDPMFSEKLRLAILNNVEELGYLFPKFFPINGNARLALDLPISVLVDDDQGRPPPIQSPSPTKTVVPCIPPSKIIMS